MTRGVPSIQSVKEPRNAEVRGVNPLPELATVHSAYAAAVVPLTEAAAAWGDPIRVLGYDFVLLGAVWTPGSLTGLKVAAQVGETEKGTLWWDLYGADSGGSVARRVWELNLATAGNVVWPIDGFGARWMRFKVWGVGAANTDSRCELRARAHMVST